MRPYLLYSLVIVSLFTASCAPEEKPVTKEDAITYARSMDSAVANGDLDVLEKMIDGKMFAERIAKGANNRLNGSFTQGVNDALKKKFGKEIVRAAHSSNGSYEFIKHYEKDKVHHVIFRLYGDDGLNYHDFELIRRDNKVAAVDIFLYNAGENLSKLMADLALSTMSDQKDENAINVQQLSKIRKLVLENKHQEAKALFDKLPAAFRGQKGPQIIYLQVCSGLGEELYMEALNEYEVRFRHEPNTYLVMFDLYFMRKEYDKALNAIDKVDSAINKDPFLDLMRGIVYSYMDNHEAARKAYENVYKMKPQFGLALHSLIICYLNMGDYEGAKPLIATYRDNKKFDQESLDADLLLYPGLKE